jgi:hypothetical protein
MLVMCPHTYLHRPCCGFLSPPTLLWFDCTLCCSCCCHCINLYSPVSPGEGFNCTQMCSKSVQAQARCLSGHTWSHMACSCSRYSTT